MPATPFLPAEYRVPTQRGDMHRFATILGVCALLSACEVEAPSYPTETTTHTVNVAVAEARQLPREIVLPGTVVVDERIDISSRITAFINTVKVIEGQSVKSGDVLATLDGAEVEGAISEAQAALRQAQASLENSRTDATRIENLFAAASATDSELRGAKLALEVASRAVDAASAALRTALAQRRYVTITAPVDGVVIARHKQPGDLATPGAPVVTIESRSQLLFETYIAERDVRKLRPEMPAEVRIDAIGRDRLRATVERIVPSGDPTTRRCLVKLRLMDAPYVLPGMFGRAFFALEEEAILIVPRSSVARRGGLAGVLVVTAQGEAQFRWVRLGREWDDRVEITAGLSAGEHYVIDPEPDIRSGDLIVRANRIITNE